MDKIERVIKLFLVFIGVIPFAIYVFALLYQLGVSDGQLSAIGSVIGGILGGVLTLLGVRMTLKNQYKQDFLKAFPKKRSLETTLSTKLFIPGGWQINLMLRRII
ncbi:hypothetical protein [Brevibacillus sp. HB2.2]|uniref:hypothetical protein n=1 Tax=Brevibacillus sp. HB2.2 TaxID=2738846 RepID=UPI00156B70E9|nr:hypothetical protein [Brevibacillus sp. HB2.2]NRS52053.1 hypothetical protein [Brevibacillus sp. HB2.2]